MEGLLSMTYMGFPKRPFLNRLCIGRPGIHDLNGTQETGNVPKEEIRGWCVGWSHLVPSPEVDGATAGGA